MKFSYKLFISLLFFSFFSMQAMESEETESNKPCKKLKLHKEQKSFQPLSLKMQSLKVLSLIKPSQFKSEDLEKLLPEWISDIRSLNIINLCIKECEKLMKLEEKQAEFKEKIHSLNLIKKINKLLYRLLNSDSKSKSLFITTVDLLFKHFISSNPVIYFTDSERIDKFFKKLKNKFFIGIKLLLTLLLDEKKTEYILFNKDSYENEFRIIDNLAEKAAKNGWIPIMQLIINLKFVNQDVLWECFNIAVCSPNSSNDFIKFLYNCLRPNEIEYLEQYDIKYSMDQLLSVKRQFTILVGSLNNPTIDRCACIFELTQQSELDIKQYIDMEYTDDDNCPHTRLLIEAVYKEEHASKWVKLFLDNGANVNVTDQFGNNALWHARERQKKAYRLFLANKISEEDFKDCQTVIDQLIDAMNKQNQN